MISNTLASSLLNLITGKVQQVGVGGNIFIGLSTTVPTSNASTGAIENISEPSSEAGYARELIGSYNTTATQVFGNVTFESTANPAYFKITNTSQVKFNKATSAWGTIVAFVLYSAKTDGNALFYGTLESSVTVDANQSCNIAEGQAILKLY